MRCRPCDLTFPARATTQLGSCAVGVRTSEGVVLGVEKRITSPLMVRSSVEKVFELDHHIGTAISGLTADSRTLVEHARVEAVNHTFVYDEPIKVSAQRFARVCAACCISPAAGHSPRAMVPAAIAHAKRVRLDAELRRGPR